MKAFNKFGLNLFSYASLLLCYVMVGKIVPMVGTSLWIFVSNEAWRQHQISVHL